MKRARTTICRKVVCRHTGTNAHGDVSTYQILLCNEITILRDGLTTGKTELVVIIIVVMVMSNNLGRAPSAVLERHLADRADCAEPAAAEDSSNCDLCINRRKQRVEGIGLRAAGRIHVWASTSCVCA